MQVKLRILNEDIQAVKKYYPDIDDNTFMQLIALDPTYKDGSNSVGKYGKWILNLFNKGNLSQEDFSDVTPLLNQFSTYRNRVPNKDLNSYKTLDDLASILSGVVDDDSMLSDRQKLRFKKNVKAGRVKVSAEDDYDVVLDTPKFIVYVPNTHEASMKLGSGTEWCTAHENPDWYNKYTKDNHKLYIILDRESGNRWQYSDKNGDFLDKDDKKFDVAELMRSDKDLSKFFAQFLGIDFFEVGDNWEYKGKKVPAKIKQYIRSVTVSGKCKRIADGAFKNCINLESIRIPDTIERIGSEAFRDCKSLTEINIPYSVSYIGESSFYGCESLRYIEIPDSVIFIGNHAFFGCKNAKSITLPESITSISEDSFSITGAEYIEIPSGVTVLGDHCFSSCHNLTNIYIPDSVTVIGSGVFSNCTQLSSVEVPNNVSEIGNYAFNQCRSLQSILIPDSVQYIGKELFYGITKNVVVYTDNEQMIDYCNNNDIVVKPTSEFMKESIIKPIKLKINEDTCCITSKTSYMDSGLDDNGIYYFGKKPEKPMNWKDYKRKKVKLERIDSTMVKKLRESDEMMTTYLTVDSKSVPDSDGFMTDYTWYVRIRCTYDEWYSWLKSRSGHNTHSHTLGDIPEEYIDGYVFVFGDSDLYTPEDGDFDFECESYEEAVEWFDDYHGFDDEYEDSYY